MRVLYITGSCLKKNTSANMSHNAFVKGLLENGAEVDIVMASDGWGEDDKMFVKLEDASYYEINSVSFSDRLKAVYKRISKKSNQKKPQTNAAKESHGNKRNIRKTGRNVLKKVFYKIFPRDPVYPLERQWLKNGLHFKSDAQYDLLISNSSPAASHRLAFELIRRKQIKCHRWIQIWEDPWFYDIYGGNNEQIKKEEHSLLRRAQKIYYVSPLTLLYQKKFFPDCAGKMDCIPLPCYAFANKNVEQSDVVPNSFGYFGDYFQDARNLKPFYEALSELGFTGFIYGDSDLDLRSTEKIFVSERVTLDVLEGVQDKTQILVHLSNLKGGQIPGKIYHYSATDKPILFILDGTEEEKRVLKEYFGKFDRYYFCENTSEDIKRTMQIIIKDKRTFSPVSAFMPKIVIEDLVKR